MVDNFEVQNQDKIYDLKRNYQVSGNISLSIRTESNSHALITLYNYIEQAR